VFLVSGGVILANIDFATKRVERGKLSIETVQQGTLEIKVDSNGQLLPRDIEYIASQVDGRVAKRYVKAGAVVTAGQVLVELTNPQLIDSAEEARSAWEGAVMDLRAAEADLQTSLLNQQVALTKAQFDLEKAQALLDAQAQLQGQHVIPEVDYKRTKLDVTQLTQTREIEQIRTEKMRANIQVQLEVKKAHVTELARALDRAKDQVANLKVVAGIGGIVQEINVDVGQQLTPGSPVGRIAQLDHLYAELRVPAREATDVLAGQSVAVDTHNGTVDGTVSRVDPAVTDGTVIIDVDLKGTLPTGARPQLPVEGVIYISQLPNSLYVGKPSYVKSNAVITVYKLDPRGDYATRVSIKAGKLSTNYLQVLEGLRAGDRIITSDDAEWRDSSRILID
jgi:HlyD family secretion protein